MNDTSGKSKNQHLHSTGSATDGSPTVGGGTVSSSGGKLGGSSSSLNQKSSSSTLPTVAPLALSVSELDGSLNRAPLSTVLAAACDSLYDDMYGMVYGEVRVTASSVSKESGGDSGSGVGSGGGGDGDNDTSTTKTKTPSTTYDKTSDPSSAQRKKMSSLSFAQRRHELATRLAVHGRSFLQVSVLLSSLVSSSSSSPKDGGSGSGSGGGNEKSSLATDCSGSIAAASTALQHIRGMWIRADEAQDALYVRHGGLWGERRSCGDVHGALAMMCKGSWTGQFPTDVLLQEDNVKDKSDTVPERLRTAVRRKLLLGEIGCFGRKERRPWRVVLEKGGYAVTLTHGSPKRRGGVLTVSQSAHDEDDSVRQSDTNRRHQSSEWMYPIEARVTVLSEDVDAEWRLLSVEVNVEPKTGESSHQLEPNNRQKFQLHRLCEETMRQEEARAASAQNEVARPLGKLFEVAHTYAISLQLEILSAQADYLRKKTLGGSIAVSPIHFVEHRDDNNDVKPLMEAAMAIHFWSCDDRHGRPPLGDLLPLDEDEEIHDNETPEKSSSPAPAAEGPPPPPPQVSNDNIYDALVQHLPDYEERSRRRLSLVLRAAPGSGIVVSLSGGGFATETKYPHLRRHVEQLQRSIQNPWSLSSSHALFHATVICAHLRCEAVAHALKDSDLLPPWIVLQVDHGSLRVSVFISQRQSFVALRLACDSRSGRFVPLTPPEGTLLRRVSREHKKVKRLFDGLVRSLHVLGDRVGVGFPSEDENALRRRVIKDDCIDVVSSLQQCCGVAALYGVAGRAMSILTGTDARADIAGDAIVHDTLLHALPVAPVGVILNQCMEELDDVDKDTENDNAEADGTENNSVCIRRDVFAMTASVCRDHLTLHCFDVVTRTFSPNGAPKRVQCTLVPFHHRPNNDVDMDFNEGGTDSSTTTIRTMTDEVMYVADLLERQEVL